MSDPDDDAIGDRDWDDMPRACWRCHGEGYGVVGDDWDCDDPVNGPYDGEVERCDCCHGTGNAEDCTYW